MARVVGKTSAGLKGSSSLEPDGSDRPIRRGDVYWADLPDPAGSTLAVTRPVVVLQNDVGNRMSRTLIVASITSRQSKRSYPVNVPLPAQPLARLSEVRACQIHTLDKSLIGSWIAHLPRNLMSRVDEAVRISLGLPRFEPGGN